MLNNTRKAKADPKGNRAARHKAARQGPRRCDEKHVRKSNPNHGKPNPNRRRDEALKLLNRGGELVKEGLSRFYIEISGKRYAVRKKIAGLLLAQRGVLERKVRGVISRWALTFVGKSWVQVTL